MKRSLTFHLAIFLLLLIRSSVQIPEEILSRIENREQIVSDLAEEVVKVFEKRTRYLKNCTCSQHLCLNEATGFECQTRLGDDPEVYGSDCKGRRVGYEWSAFKTPPNTPLQDMEPRLKEAICLYANLEPKMRELVTPEQGNFLYFSGIEGHQRIYPVLARRRGLPDGDEELNRCDKYDPRIRPWFMAASTRPKDIVLVIDGSESMTSTLRYSSEQTRWDITQDAVLSMLKTFTSSDYINIVMFSDSATRLSNTSSLLRGTAENLEFLKNETLKQSPDGLTNFDAAFKEAFDILTKACDENPEIQSCSYCQKVIFFLTDGRDTSGPNAESIAATEMLNRIEEYQRGLEEATDHRATIFTFSMSEDSDGSLPRQIACANEGSWSYIGHGTEPLSAMTGYYHFLTNPSSNNSAVWVNPYLGAGGQGNITTVSKAVFSEGRGELEGIFLGVVGHTVLLKDLEAPGYTYQDVLDALSSIPRTCGVIRQSECQLQVHRNIYANKAVCPDNISFDKNGYIRRSSRGVTPCYRSSNNKFYKLFLRGTAWRRALGQCRRDGGQLATIQSEEELAFVAGLSSPDGSWIGARRNLTDLRWEWTDSKANNTNLELSSAYWAIGEPNSYRGNEDCLEIDRRGVSGNLNDRHCEASLTYICEYTTGETCDKIVSLPEEGYFSVPPLSECVHEEIMAEMGQPLPRSEALTTEEVMCPLGEPANNFSVICCPNCEGQ